MYRLVLISHLLSLRSEARLASYSICRWGAPAAREHPITLSPQQRITPHTVAHTQWGDTIQSGPEGQVFPGIVTHVHGHLELHFNNVHHSNMYMWSH